MWKIVTLQQEKLLHQGPQPNFLSWTIFWPARGLFNAFGGLFVWLIVCFFVCLFVLFLAFLVVLQSQLPPPHLSSDERCSPAVKRHGRCLWLESGETRWFLYHHHCDCNKKDDDYDGDYDDDDYAPPPASPSHKYGNSNHGSILTFPGFSNFPFSLVTLASAGNCF